MINVLEKSREAFLYTFNQIRDDIEHQNLVIPKFEINTESGDFSEPSLTNKGTLIEELSYFYNSILEMVEVLMIYYFGILAIEKNEKMGIFMRKEYDYTKLKYRFVLLPKIKMEGYQLII
ncbi:MAG: hypothetical protein ACK4TA_20895 [Saprospiraceae bacterium]